MSGKGTTWEGGMRVPAAISFPSFIPPGTLDQPVKSKSYFELLCHFNLCHHRLNFFQLSALSLLPTILALVDKTMEPVNTHTLYVIQASSSNKIEIRVAFFTSPSGVFYPHGHIDFRGLHSFLP